ncbi:hypothetical protein AVEN_139679-1 [Araneus ventricosus]|uniref:Uncharacterized protein n=1 Tax=Araneus ventricosus TaxID=182803 RepID=A0A4Y2PGM5_ARAVE|nr:hypothetical protein AVEN_139679-1 [Araneus ventricosus]
MKFKRGVPSKIKMQFSLLLVIREERLKKKTPKEKKFDLSVWSDTPSLHGIGSLLRWFASGPGGQGSRENWSVHWQLCWIHLSGRYPFSAWDRPSPPLVRIGTRCSRKPGNFVVQKNWSVHWQLRWILIWELWVDHHIRAGLCYAWALAQSSGNFVVRKNLVRSLAAPLVPHSGIMGRSPHPHWSMFCVGACPKFFN